MRASQDRPEAARVVVYGVTGSGKSVLRRTVVRIVDRRPVCNGNTETWRQTFSRESIIAWHFRSFASKRRRIAEWEADPDVPPVRRLRSTRETEEWLAGLTSSTTAEGAA